MMTVRWEMGVLANWTWTFRKTSEIYFKIEARRMCTFTHRTASSRKCRKMIFNHIFAIELCCRMIESILYYQISVKLVPGRAGYGLWGGRAENRLDIPCKHGVDLQFFLHEIRGSSMWHLHVFCQCEIWDIQFWIILQINRSSGGTNWANMVINMLKSCFWQIPEFFRIENPFLL